MSQNDTTTADEPLDDSPPPLDTLGRAEVQIDVNAATYERLREEYERQGENAYADSFDGFVLNYTVADCTVTVNGEPVDGDGLTNPRRSEPADFGGGESTGVQQL